MSNLLNSIKDKTDGTIDKFGKYYKYIVVGFNIIYFATLIGIVSINVKYLSTFNICIQSIICLFLIYRFNPLRENIRLKSYDSTIIFSSAIFLLFNLGVTEILKKVFPVYSSEISSVIKSI
jgi:hypothetical protein